MRRVPALLLALAVVGTATPASAHVPARARLASPAEDARVVGDAVRVVVVGEGGTAAASFRLDLDGRPVDAAGRVGGLFTTLTVRPQQQTELTVGGVAPGTHTLTLTPEQDVDSSAPTVVRRFRVVADEKGGGGLVAAAFVGLLVLGGVGAAVAVRRKAAA
ncbi:MAG TPA: hypothetical protein VFQ85_18750 [Mycobacteriales bacterium]|nr:hypothetical protein [Mycobacteriales bacterium]